jgi:hypothetical protein
MHRTTGRRVFYRAAATACIGNFLLGSVAACWSFKAQNSLYASLLVLISIAQLGLSWACASKARERKTPALEARILRNPKHDAD